MKKPDPINKVKHSDEFSSGLMEQYGKWMGGDCFQNTEMPDLHEAPFDGMDPQSNGAEIEDTTKKKKSAKKEGSKAQLATKEEVEVLEREEYEIDGEKYILEKIKGADGKACWKGYKYNGTKNGKDDCVKAGDEVSHDGEQLDEYGKVKKKKSNKYVSEHHEKDADGNVVPHEDEAPGTPSSVEEIKEKKLDPVGKADKDIDNDGDHDKTDKYLIARRKKVSKILGMKKKK